MAQLTLYYIRDTSRRELLLPRGHRKAWGPFLSCPSPLSVACAPAQPHSGQGPASVPPLPGASQAARPDLAEQQGKA